MSAPLGFINVYMQRDFFLSNIESFYSKIREKVKYAKNRSENPQNYWKKGHLITVLASHNQSGLRTVSYSTVQCSIMLAICINPLVPEFFFANFFDENLEADGY